MPGVGRSFRKSATVLLGPYRSLWNDDGYQNPVVPGSYAALLGTPAGQRQWAGTPAPKPLESAFPRPAKPDFDIRVPFTHDDSLMMCSRGTHFDPMQVLFFWVYHV